MKPMIGITSQFQNVGNRKMVNVNSTYINAVVEAEAIPVIIPIINELDDIDNYLDVIDGIIFTGGDDLSPLIYGEEPIKQVDEICNHRDTMELELFKRAYKRKLPILGICRGLQLINIALEGTLFQDIDRQVSNSIGHVCTYNVEQGYHSIIVIRDSIIFNIFNKERIIVNSVHHQSIKDIGKGLKITSTSIDNIIESIESTNENFVLGVQFHPEAMIYKNKEFINLFTYFTQACK